MHPYYQVFPDLLIPNSLAEKQAAFNSMALINSAPVRSYASGLLNKVRPVLVKSKLGRRRECASHPKVSIVRVFCCPGSQTLSASYRSPGPDPTVEPIVAE
jgi:hypothetical protein